MLPQLLLCKIALNHILTSRSRSRAQSDTNPYHPRPQPSPDEAYISALLTAAFFLVLFVCVLAPSAVAYHRFRTAHPHNADGAHHTAAHLIVLVCTGVLGIVVWLLIGMWLCWAHWYYPRQAAAAEFHQEGAYEDPFADRHIAKFGPTTREGFIRGPPEPEPGEVRNFDAFFHPPQLRRAEDVFNPQGPPARKARLTHVKLSDIREGRKERTGLGAGREMAGD